MIVIDASAVLELLLRTSSAMAIEARIFETGETLHAPHLIDLEVTQVLRRYASSGRMDAARCEAALAVLADFVLSRYPHDTLLPRVWELRANLTAYDAAYVALAEMLGATLVTCDKKLAAAPGHSARIEVM